MQAVPPSAAAMPTGSHTVRGDNNKTPMPATPSTLAPKARRAGRRPSTPQARPITSSGWMAPTTAARPPGKR